MSVSKITIEKADLYKPIGFVQHIGKYIPGKLKHSSFPIDVVLVDSISQNEYPAELLSCLGFDAEIIPTQIALMVCGKYPSELEVELVAKNKVKSISNLGAYVYRFK